VVERVVLDVSAAQWDDLRARLRSTRRGPRWPVEGWAAGTNPDTLDRLVAYWADGYDWFAQQRAITALPWQSAEINGTELTYLRFDSEQPDALPIVLTNGWPSTAIELVPLARLLASTGFTVIVPALPGFPLSPQRPTHDEQTHELWHSLMHDELGFERYAAHGGDLGAGITSRLAQAHAESVVGIHLLAVATPHHDDSTLTAEERIHVDAMRTWAQNEGGYQLQQQTRPLSLAPALSDSPAGLLAWILEKYRTWSDGDGIPFSDDFLLTQASLYWFTNSISTSFRPYWEFASGITARVRQVTVPTALAVFPHDLSHAPRSWAEREYNLTRYTVMPRGGHFAPIEEPQLLADDIRAFFA